jgi:hypothetical protein
MVDFSSAVFKMMCRRFRIPALATTTGCGGILKKAQFPLVKLT